VGGEELEWKGSPVDWLRKDWSAFPLLIEKGSIQIQILCFFSQNRGFSLFTSQETLVYDGNDIINRIGSVFVTESYLK
jgi:hypothetical protein